MLHQQRLAAPNTSWPVLICLLGNFRLFKTGQPVAVQSKGKAESLLCHLGLRNNRRVPREQLVSTLWPSSEPALGNQSLNSLIYSLRKLIGDAIHGSMPIVHENGYYRLNIEAGVNVDLVCFENLSEAGDLQAKAGNFVSAAEFYRQAIELYRGDLCVATDVDAIIERERLHNQYLTLLANLSDYSYSAGDYVTSMDFAWKLLISDPCREDAHRRLMRCYVQRGERAAALRHYRQCVELLNSEFGAVPEPATTALYEQIRLDSGHI